MSEVHVDVLRKAFGETHALDGVSFSVPSGTIFGLLGPNGAGKTTTISVLATLLEPDEGHATVAGFDVVGRPEEVRSRIALTGQFAALDEVLTGRENLVLFGRLLRLGTTEAADRADALLDRFDLADAADQPVKGYSGGMRRRLDLAASLVVEPEVLFLDEPTTGLDPRSRESLWVLVEELRSHGMTILLTTQYLEEADRLADRLAVVDHGRVIADGTAEQLKASVGGTVCELALVQPGRTDVVAAALTDAGLEPTLVDVEVGSVSIPAPAGPTTLVEVVRVLDPLEVEVADLGLRRPSLDDVFFALTGHGPASTEGIDDADAVEQPAESSS